MEEKFVAIWLNSYITILQSVIACLYIKEYTKLATHQKKL